MTHYYATMAEAEAEAARLNSERRSSAFSYGANEGRDYTKPDAPLQGYYVGMYSDD